MYFLSAETDNYLILMADTDKISDNFTFLYFIKFVTCSLCTVEGKKGEDVVSKYGYLLFQSSDKLCVC